MVPSQWGSGDAHMHRSISLHRGPGHVCEWVNATFCERTAGRDVLGIPAREAFAEPEYAPLQTLMDLAFTTGREQWAEFRGGLFAALPRVQKGRVVGVAVVYQPASQPLRHLPEMSQPGQLAPLGLPAGRG